MPVPSFWTDVSVKSKRRVVTVHSLSLNILAFTGKDFMQPLSNDWSFLLGTTSAQHYTNKPGSVEHGCSFAGLLY